jgi:hypothetical protein
MRRFLIATASIIALTSAASSQTLPQGLVTVNLQNVLSDIAVDLNVEENSIPVNVQVPVSVAANVCGVDVNVLSVKIDSGDATCVAQTGSQEVTQIIQQQVASGGGGNSSGNGDTPTDEVAGGNGNTGGNGNGGGNAGGSDSDDDEVAGGNGNGNRPDKTQTGSTNSAKEFAPGQQTGPANEAAPGRSDKMAPGQAKRACDDAANCPAD